MRLRLLFAALALAGCSVGERAASLQLRDAIARVRAAGEPVTFDELRGSRPSDDSDAAPDYRAGVALLADVDPQMLEDLLRAYRAASRSCPTMPPSHDVRARAHQVLSQSAAALAFLDDAARKESCHFAFGQESGELPAFTSFRRASALLSIRTLDLASAGAADRAADSLVSELQMLRVFQTEPVTISYLVRLALWERACLSLPAVLGAGTLSEPSLGDLERALARAEAPDQLQRSLEGERVWYLMWAATNLGPDWPDDELRVAGARRQPAGERLRFFRQANDYLTASATMILAAGEPWPQVRDSMVAADPAPMFWSVPMERAGQVLAATRAGRVAIAIERLRRRRRALPTSLAELPSPRPVDPFTGSDLLYQRDEDTYLVSSAGSGAHLVEQNGWDAGVRVCLRSARR